MTIHKNIKNQLITTTLLVLVIILIFISSWNSYIKNTGNTLLPVVFLFISLLLILYLIYSFLFDPEKHSEENETDNSRSKLQKGNQQDNKEVIYIKPDDIVRRIMHKTPGKNIRGKKVLQNLAAEFNAMQAVLFILNPETSLFEVHTSYAMLPETAPQPFRAGEGLHGQAVAEKKVSLLSNLPENFRIVTSGLGDTYARFLYLMPVIHDDNTIALLEFSTLKEIGETGMSVLNILMTKLGQELNSMITGSDEK